MVEDEQEPTDGLEGPRRKTFTPPDPDAVFTGSFPVIDADIEDVEVVIPQPTPPAVSQPRAATDPPLRQSLTDQEIMARFEGGHAGTTAQMIAELERQVSLRQEEEEAFQMWANLVRATRGPLAEQIISRERIIFDGGEPEPEPEPEPAPEPEIDDESVDEALDAVDQPVSASELESQGEIDESEPAEGESDQDDVVEVEEPVGEPVDELEETALDAAVTAGDEDLAALVAEQEPVDEPDVPGDQWPLQQKSEPEEPARVVSDTEETAPQPPREKTDVTAGLLWMFSASLVPVLGIIGGAFLVFRGLGVLEALVAVGSAGLLAGLVIAAGASLAKRRGQSTLVSAQQTFGRVGNAIPSGILLVIRIAALAILLVLTVSVATRVLELSGLWPFDLWIAQAVVAGVVSSVVMVLSIGGGRVLRIALWVSAAVGFVGLIAVVVRNASSLTFVTQSWSAEPLAVIGGASLVLSGFLVLWGATGGDLTDIRVGQGRSIVPLVAALGAIVPLAGVMMVSVWLAVSTPGSSVSLVADPVGVLVQGLPSWYPGPVLALLVIPLVGVASLILFSMGKGVEALGVPSSRVLNTSVVGAVSIVAAAAVIVLGLDVANDVPGVLVGVGVIFAAWAGAFAIDSVMSRGADVHAVPGWRIAPLAGMVAAIGVGFGLVSSGVSWLSWQGYLLPLLNNAGLIDLSPAAPGVLVALILSALVTLVASLGARVKAPAQSHG